MKYKVSVIIPVYNAQKYLRYSLQSIIKQDFDNYEVLLINDGSTDNSINICNEFVKKYNFVKLINKKNEGVSSARNVGLDLAQGQYIVFVDADDWLTSNCLNILYNKIIKNNCDIVIGCSKIIYPHVEINDKLNNEIYSIGDNKIFEQINDIGQGVCARIFKKEIIDVNQIRFKKIKQLEDSTFLYKYLCHCNSICTIDSVVYCYNKLEENTLSSSFCMNYLDFVINNFEEKNKFFSRWNNSNEAKKAIVKEASLTYVDIFETYLKYNNDNKIDVFKNSSLYFMKFLDKDIVNNESFIKIGFPIYDYCINDDYDSLISNYMGLKRKKNVQERFKNLITKTIKKTCYIFKSRKYTK